MRTARPDYESTNVEAAAHLARMAADPAEPPWDAPSRHEPLDWWDEDTPIDLESLDEAIDTGRYASEDAR